MSRQAVYWSGFGLVLLVAGIILLNNLSPQNDSLSTETQTTTQTQMSSSNKVELKDTATLGEGSYVTYSEAEFASANDSDERWLFFHAPWCPQCRELEKDILSSGVPEGVTIFKVDYDSATDLRQKYGVTLQTTVVSVGPDGEKIASTVPYSDPKLSTVLTAFNR